MKFEVYNKDEKNTKVAFFSKRAFGTTLSNFKNVEKIATHNKLEIHLFDTDDENFLKFNSFKEHQFLKEKEIVSRTYKYILEYLIKNDIKVCIFFGSGYPWVASFLEEVKRNSYVACYFGDDPEGAEYTSRYYVKNYHYAFCGGIYFDAKKRISEKYLEWGARKSKFIPLGANPDKYEESTEIDKGRNVDIVYVGGAYLKKIIRIFKLKKHFGERMKLYGRGWNYSGNNIFKKIISKVIKDFYNIKEIEELPNDQLINLYQNAKIGFNMHMSYGPSNLRTYELPMNGVMQICDCEKGLNELYEIDKEVISYKNIAEAIEKIEYYLKHDEERVLISKAGQERAKKKYKVEDIFGCLMGEIILDIRENFENTYKYER